MTSEHYLEPNKLRFPDKSEGFHSLVAMVHVFYPLPPLHHNWFTSFLLEN